MGAFLPLGEAAYAARLGLLAGLGVAVWAGWRWAKRFISNQPTHVGYEVYRTVNLGLDTGVERTPRRPSESIGARSIQIFRNNVQQAVDRKRIRSQC